MRLPTAVKIVNKGLRVAVHGEVSIKAAGRRKTRTVEMTMIHNVLISMNTGFD